MTWFIAQIQYKFQNVNVEPFLILGMGKGLSVVNVGINNKRSVEQVIDDATETRKNGSTMC